MNPNRKGPEKLLVFPYDYGFAPVVRHVEWRSRFSIFLLASFKGSGLCGHDGGIADEAGDLGIVVESDFDSCLQKCDSVLFLEPNLPLSFKDDIQPLIERATANKKNIYLSWSVPGEATNAISLICATRGVEFWDFQPAVPHLRTLRTRDQRMRALSQSAPRSWQSWASQRTQTSLPQRWFSRISSRAWDTRYSC